MEALVPIPWAHIIFGQRAMFEAAEKLYDDPEFQPRHWDLDDQGNKLPNKWRQWRSFAEQSYVNELSTGDFRHMVKAAGFSVARYDRFGLYSSRPRSAPLTRALSGLPLIGEYFTSHVVIELKRG